MLTIIMAVALAGSPGPAKAEIDGLCRAGSSEAAAPVGPAVSGVWASETGETPATIPGGTRISVGEFECLSQAYGDRLLVLSAMELGESVGLPRSVTIIGGGVAAFEEYDASRVERVKSQLDYLTSGDLDRPLVAYCHHLGCFQSFNLLQRAAKAGYRNLYWLRGGLKEWRDAGKPEGLIGMSFDGLGSDTVSVVSCAAWSQVLAAAGLLDEAGYDAFIAPHVERISQQHSPQLLGAAFDVMTDAISSKAEDLDPFGLSAEELAQVRAENYAPLDEICLELPGSAGLYP